jgi:hypothetical protein
VKESKEYDEFGNSERAKMEGEEMVNKRQAKMVRKGVHLA